MLDELYENIGGKIKNWAKWIFIVEVIAAVITGIALIVDDGDENLVGVLVMFVGPIVAWIGSWILYAFGELVEKTSENESNTKQILEKLHNKQPKEDLIKKAAQKIEHTNVKRCPYCGDIVKSDKCEMCGKEINL